jgi:HAD superfamily hydrolase (TIGR01549 family)
MKNALILSGGGFQGLALVRALHLLTDINVTVCDIFPDNLTRYVCANYLLAPPLSDTDAFVEFLLKAVEREKVDVVFPATARELPLLSQLKDKLRTIGVYAAVSDARLLATLLDKQLAYLWMHVRKLPAQALHEPSSFHFPYPLFGRPRDGWGGRGTLVLRNTDDAAPHLEDSQNYIWTRWLPSFEEFSADFAIGANGQISPIVLRKRLRVSGGFSVVSDSISNATLESLTMQTARIIATEGGCGLFNIQILVPDGGEPVISDINPRIGTSATHGLAEGINLPGFFLASTAQRAEDPETPPRKMVRTVRLLDDLIIPHLDNKPRGIVFDLDDTLVDHKLWMLKKIELLYINLFEHRVTRETFFECAARLIDEGVRSDLIDRMLAELSLPVALREEAINAYRAAIVSDTPLFDDVYSTLETLKAGGFKLAILTDNPPATQRSKIQHAPALQMIDTVIYAREHGGEKPHPSGFLQAAQALDTHPGQLVMVGDNYYRDGLGALQAGYMHSLIIQRKGTFLSHSTSVARHLGVLDESRISLVDSLLSVIYACTAP